MCAGYETVVGGGSIVVKQDWHYGREGYEKGCVRVQRHDGPVGWGGIDFAVRSTGCVDRSSTTRLCFVFAYRPRFRLIVPVLAVTLLQLSPFKDISSRATACIRTRQSDKGL